MTKVYQYLVLVNRVGRCFETVALRVLLWVPVVLGEGDDDEERGGPQGVQEDKHLVLVPCRILGLARDGTRSRSREVVLFEGRKERAVLKERQ